VSSATHAPSSGWLWPLIAGRHAASGKARIASRTHASIAYPNENRTPVSRQDSASAWLASAESEREDRALQRPWRELLERELEHL
jgi:hypothetical protein